MVLDPDSNSDSDLSSVLFGSRMDPPTLMNENAFQSANAASYNLSEIWPFSINGGGGLELRRTTFGVNLSQFREINANREVSGNDSLGMEPRGGVQGCGGGGSGHGGRGCGGGGARKRREAVGSEDESGKGVSTSSGNGLNDADGKRLKTSRSRDENHKSKADGEGNSAKGAEDKIKPPPEPPKDYIHVRARRGQATDSHSLAERARREKISERMRILQDLVPGCNKVIGKALVLDEIINYIQSLQRQVEFLSMKLEAVNSRMNIGIEGYPSKDFVQQAFDASAVQYGSQAPREYGRGSSPEWLHMQIGSGFER
ncbi:hypothetical protein Ancab_020614 [Ancistrocladus abbreviatus]